MASSSTMVLNLSTTKLSTTTKTTKTYYLAWSLAIMSMMMMMMSMSGGHNGGMIRGAQALEVGYYSKSCPNAEKIVRKAMEALLVVDVTASAALVRLVFHDCEVRACDASILLRDDLQNITSELNSAKNFGIRRLEFIDHIKTALELECRGVVSCADIIVLAARDSIAQLGGPLIPVLTGRKDSLRAYKEEADAVIPAATATVDDVLQSFKRYDLTMDETVALLGSHTLGVSHCLSFKNRLGESAATLDPVMGKVLREVCRDSEKLIGMKRADNATFALNDETSTVFDNVYFKQAQAKRGLLTIDAGLASDARTTPIVRKFATDRLAFFDAYTTGFLKLTQASVISDAGNAGQVRRHCASVN